MHELNVIVLELHRARIFLLSPSPTSWLSPQIETLQYLLSRTRARRMGAEEIGGERLLVTLQLLPQRETH